MNEMIILDFLARAIVLCLKVVFVGVVIIGIINLLENPVDKRERKIREKILIDQLNRKRAEERIRSFIGGRIARDWRNR